MANKSAQFFGIEIELWKIGDSPAAPRFNVVCQPNYWETTVLLAAETLADDDERPSHKLRIKYWTAFREYLLEAKSKLRPQEPSRQHWYTFGIGTSRAHTSALLISKDNKIGVNLTINSEDAKSIFSELLVHKQEIEAIIGPSVEWREMPNNKASRIMVFKPVNPFDETNWPEQFEWLKCNLEKFDQAFRPLLAKKLIG